MQPGNSACFSAPQPSLLVTFVCVCVWLGGGGGYQWSMQYEITEVGERPA